VRAPRDPAWEADGIVSEQWAPVSPVTGRLDAFEWREPPERLGQVIEPDLLEPPVLAEPKRAEPKRPAPAIEAKPAGVETAAKDGGAMPERVAKTIAATEVAPVPSVAGDGKAEPDTLPAESGKAGVVAADAGSGARSGPQPQPQPQSGPQPRPRRSSADGEGQREARIPPPPDDPGVKRDEEEEETAPGRFRLF
jgi:HemY protein